MKKILLSIIVLVTSVTVMKGQEQQACFTPIIEVNAGRAWGTDDANHFFIPTLQVDVGCDISFRHGSLMVTAGLGNRSYYSDGAFNQLTFCWQDNNMLQIRYRYRINDRWSIAMGASLRQWTMKSDMWVNRTDDTWFKQATTSAAKPTGHRRTLQAKQFTGCVHLDGYYALSNYCYLHGGVYYLYTPKEYRENSDYIHTYNLLQIGVTMGLQIRLGCL